MDKNKFSEDETLDIQDPENNQEDDLDEEDLDNEDTEDQDNPENDDQGSEDDDDEGKDEPENKFKKAYENQKTRAEKAEAKLKELMGDKGDKKPAPAKKPASNVKAQELSQTDTYTLLRNNIHEDDVKDVVDYARLRGISISEAIKSPLVKSIISENESKRTTSKVASKGNEGRRGSYRVPVEVLLSNARKGIYPDNDADLDRLVDAQMAQRKNKNKK